MKCPFCHSQEPNHRNPTANSSRVECENCGEYSITAEALLLLKDDSWKLSSYVAEQNRRGFTPLFYSTQVSIPKDAPIGSVGVDAAIQSFPRSVTDRLDRALLNLAAATHYLGQTIRIAVEDVNPLLLSQNTSEVVFVLRQFLKEDYVSGWSSGLPGELSLTAKGLNRAADLQRGLFGPFNKQVFVALSFDMSLDIAWADGLKLGIEDCGYTALRVDAKEHNEKICDVIVASKGSNRTFALFFMGVFVLLKSGS